MSQANRLDRLRPILAEKEIDGILVSQPENRYYLSGFDGSAGYLVITPRDAILATDFRYLEQARTQAPDYRIFPITGNLSDWLPHLVAEANLRQLGFEAGDITFAFYRQVAEILKKAQPRLKLIPLEGLVESLRVIKEPAELELITQAVATTDKALAYISAIIHHGMTEREVAWEIEKFLREQDSQTLPFEVIVAAGPNSALPHAKPSSRPISSGEPIVIDIGARFAGYASDLTRTLCLGEPDDTFQKIYDTVLGAQLAAIALIKESMTGEEADSFARTIIKEAGYGAAFGHGLGHGVGLSVHELPRLGPNANDRLTPGMVFSLEPGIYLTGWGGVRIEDLVVMAKDGVRILSQARK